MKNRTWSREELLLAFNLYCKIPFGQFHHRNQHVIELAHLIERTPNAVAMKLSNFAALDPYHKQRGISGLSNTSKADQAIWNEVTANWNHFVDESEKFLEQLRQTKGKTETSDAEQKEELHIPVGPTQVQQTVNVRRGQNFFHETILANYRSRCCICGIPIPELLIASHIIPWADNETTRLDPTNGLCLCSLHDKGFDRGLITVDTDYRVILSTHFDQYLPNETIHQGFIIYNHREIDLPDKFLPDKEFLSIHNTRYFRT